MRRICSWLRLSILLYPRAAAITVPVVEAIPFVVKIWLYGADSPVSRSQRS